MSERIPTVRIIVAGSRDFDDYGLMSRKLAGAARLESVEIVSGGARGADALGERFARENGIPVKRFEADWGRFGKAAGPIRNSQMAEYAAEAERGYLVAFPMGRSPGTRDMIRKAKEKGLTAYVVETVPNG